MKDNVNLFIRLLGALVVLTYFVVCLVIPISIIAIVLHFAFKLW